MTPDVSVIIPVRNDAAGLNACLDALAAQVGGLTVQVVVADNGSTDASAALAHEHPAVTTVVVESRRGSYAARNAGITAAEAPVLAFTDADCTPDPDWLVEGLRHLDGADLAAGAVRMLVPRMPSVWAVWDAAHYLNQEAFVADGFGATANLFVRRSTVDAVGPFDPALLSSGDLEFGRRATGRGHQLVYAASAIVAHPPRTTAREFWHLQRRLGAGWRTLAARGERPWAPRDPFMRPPFADVIVRAHERGLPVRRRRLAGAHALALAGRWTGRISGR